ncbi:MAG: hypothetical protein H6Q89_5557 [Myxococcaceae bacterium]|nr:hypothetical protein [Myxococcaceae bacterium]
MRFPTRTLILMVLAMLAFGWMYWQTHRAAPQSTPDPAEAAPEPLKARPVEPPR